METNFRIGSKVVWLSSLVTGTIFEVWTIVGITPMGDLFLVEMQFEFGSKQTVSVLVNKDGWETDPDGESFGGNLEDMDLLDYEVPHFLMVLRK